MPHINWNQITTNEYSLNIIAFLYSLNLHTKIIICGIGEQNRPDEVL